MRNNRHVSDIGSLVHEATDLWISQYCLIKPPDLGVTYLFYRETVEREYFSKHSLADTNALRHVLLGFFHRECSFLKNSWENG